MANRTYTGIGARMHSYRMRTGKSMEVCADAAGVCKQTWYSVEDGHQTPRDITVAKIERLIGKEDADDEDL